MRQTGGQCEILEAGSGAGVPGSVKGFGVARAGGIGERRRCRGRRAGLLGA